MEQLERVIKEHLNDQIISIIISNQRKKSEKQKVKIRPILKKDQLLFQSTERIGTKEVHKNYEKEDLWNEIEHLLREEFKQIELLSKNERVQALVSKKGKATIKIKKEKYQGEVSLAHNRTKKYVLEIGKPIDFLVDLGIMTEKGDVVHSKYDKFRQINRYLEFIEDILPHLPKDRELTIIDFGCGKSYLTFAMYYYLRMVKGYDIRVIGLDLKADVIAYCNQLKEKYNYDKLQFIEGDIASFEGVSKVDMVVSLHACDKATDYAIDKAVKWGATVIFAVPCCQHELNTQMKNELLEPILKYGLLRERFCAMVTDGLRAELLEMAGYRTQILEFIDMEHTPKNLLIRGILTNKKANNKEEYEKLRTFLQVDPTLEKLWKGTVI